MREKLVAAAAVLALLLGPACGKKGPLRPPLVLVPQPVETLTAVQRGGQVILEWTNPESFIDGRPLGEIGAVEVWLQEKSETPPKEKERAVRADLDFESQGKRIALLVPKREAQIPEAKKGKPGAGSPRPQSPQPHLNSGRAGADFSFTYSLEPAAWTGKILVFAVRASDPKNKKFSDFSNEVSVKPQLLPGPPASITAETFADRVDIRWKAPEVNFDGSKPPLTKGYNVYRIDREAGGPPKRLNPALLPGTEFSDRDFLFDRPYQYVVRASASESEPFFESSESPSVDILPRDVFPPTVPSGLASLRSQDYVTLVWDSGKESDLAGYNVWRRAEGEPDFVCLTRPPILENTYTDRSIEKNKRYEYAISALDTRGNESPKSASVAEIIKDPET